MIKVIENSVEISYEEAIRKYNGYCLGMQIVDACETYVFRVKVMLYSDEVPNKEFCDLAESLGVTFIEWAIAEDRHFYTREEHEKMEARYKNSEAFKEFEIDRIKKDAIMLVGDIAFCIESDDCLKVYNLSDISQTALLYSPEDNTLSLKNSSLSSDVADECMNITLKNNQYLKVIKFKEF